MRISGAAWLHSPEMETLWNLLPGMRAVGGCVRDTLMGREVGDVDLATALPPDRVMHTLQARGIKALPTGIEHGTVTAILGGRGFEITTLRRDTACDGRHATVEYTARWEEDAARRDFTVNALYADKDGTIYDYYDGLGDLKLRCLRFIGDAEKRIEEDALRMLRLFRFAAQWQNFTIDLGAIAACARLSERIHKLSGERIQQEMKKLLAAPVLAAAEFLPMAETGVLRAVMPGPGEVEWSRLMELERHHRITPDPWRRLLRLLQPATAEEWIAALRRRWKLSNHDGYHLNNLASAEAVMRRDSGEREIKKLIRRYGNEVVRDAMLVHASRSSAAPLGSAFRLTQVWRAPEFPVTGKDLLDQGFATGKELGDMLKRLETAWEESDYKLTKTALLKLLIIGSPLPQG